MVEKKFYPCPQGGCRKVFEELIEIRGHLAWEHEFWVDCTEEKWEMSRKGKDLESRPAKLHEIQWGWCKVNKKSMKEFQKRRDDGRIDEKGRATGKSRSHAGSLIGLTGKLVNFQPPSIKVTVPKAKVRLPLKPINGVVEKLQSMPSWGDSISLVKGKGNGGKGSEMTERQRKEDELKLFEEFRLFYEQEQLKKSLEIEKMKEKSMEGTKEKEGKKKSMESEKLKEQAIEEVKEKKRRREIDDAVSSIVQPSKKSHTVTLKDLTDQKADNEKTKGGDGFGLENIVVDVSKTNEDAIKIVDMNATKGSDDVGQGSLMVDKRNETEEGSLMEEQEKDLLNNVDFALLVDDMFVSDDSDIGDSVSKTGGPQMRRIDSPFPRFTTLDVLEMMAILSDGIRVKLPFWAGPTLQLLASHFPNHDPQDLIFAVKMIIGVMNLAMSRSDLQLMEDTINRSKGLPEGPTETFSTYVKRDIERTFVIHVDKVLKDYGPSPTMAMLANGLGEKDPVPSVISKCSSNIKH